MRERLVDVIRKLESAGWNPDAKLIVALRLILEGDDKYCIDEIFDAFR